MTQPPSNHPQPGYAPPGYPPHGGYAVPTYYGPPVLRPTGPRGLPLAEFGERLLAYLLDSLVLGAILLLPMLFAIFLLLLPLLTIDASSHAAPDALVFFGSLLGFFVVTFGAQLLGTYLYQVTYQTRTGVTVGKRVMKLRVVDAETGAPMDVSAARKRWIIHLLLAFAGPGAYLDGLWQLWDQKKQTLHDKVARTVVVKVPA